MLNLPRRLSIPVAVAVAWLLLPPLYLWRLTGQNSLNDEPVFVLSQYLRAVYARDFSQAYEFISSQDQGLKNKDVYVRERGAFTDFPLKISQRLASEIKIRPIQLHPDEEGRMHIKVGYSLPDADAVGPLVLDWNEQRLSLASVTEQQKILDSLEHLARNRGLKMIRGEEEFVLVKESAGWKIFLDWASGVQIRFSTAVPPDRAIEARPTIPQTIGQPGELFTVEYVVKNRSYRDLHARVLHRVEPAILADYLDLVECALLLPVRVKAGEEQTFASTYLIRGDMPEGTKSLTVTYEFQLEG